MSLKPKHSQADTAPDRMIVRFPFTVQQVGDNAVELVFTNQGVKVPELSTNGEQAEAWDKAFGLTEDEHMDAVEKAQRTYLKALIVASIKVE